MASSYSNTPPRSTSPARRHSRVNDAVQVAPYLTHVVRHHGQVTLIPPENSGRIRRAKKRRPAIVRGESSGVLLDLPRPSTSSSQSRSTPNSPRPHSAGSIPIPQNETKAHIRTSHSRHGTHEELGIPDFPPPSFEEAMRTTPLTNDPNASSPGDTRSSVVNDVSGSAEQDVNCEPDPCPASPARKSLSSSLDVETLSPTSSHSSLEELTEAKPPSLWEQDREAGYNLEERVQRELERRRLEDSLPRAPVMRLFEDSDPSNVTEDANTIVRVGQTGGVKRLDRRKLVTHRRPGSPGSSRMGDSPPPELRCGVVHECSERLASSSQSQNTRNDDSPRSDNSHPVLSKGKGKEKESAHQESSSNDSPFPLDQTQIETTLSRLRDVHNVPLRPRVDRSDATFTTHGSWTLITPKRPPPSELNPGSSTSDDAETSQSISHFVHSQPVHDSRCVSTSTNTVSPPSRPPSEGSNGTPSVVPLSSSVILASSPATSPSIESPDRPPSTHVDPVCQPLLPERRIPPPEPPSRTSVRERISAFESLQSRPIPPPPPRRPIIRRPPPPLPEPSNFEGSHAQVAVHAADQMSSLPGMVTSAEQRNDNHPALPRRRRSPPPIPPRRRAENKNAPQTHANLVTSSAPSSEPAPSTSSAVTASIENIYAEGPRLVLDSNVSEETSRTSPGLSVDNSENSRSPVNARPTDSTVDLHGADMFQSRGEDPHDVVSSESANFIAEASQSSRNGQESEPPCASIRDSPLLEEISRGDSYGSSSVSTSSTPLDNALVHLEDRSERTLGLDNNVADGQEQVISVRSSSTQQLRPSEPMFTCLTDLDLLLARLDDPDFTHGGRSFDDLLLLEEIMGPASGYSAPHQTRFEDIPLGRVEVLRRRVTKDGRVKLKLALLGVVVDKCGICLAQFKGDVFACLLPCRHAFHERCLRLWMRRGVTCPLCRGPLCIA